MRQASQAARELVAVHLRQTDIEQRHLRDESFNTLERFARAINGSH